MRNQNTYIASGLGILFLSVSIGACAVFLHEVEKKKETLHELGLLRAQTESRKKTLMTLTTALTDTKEERAYLTSRILKEEDVVDFLTLIESLGREQGTKLTTSSLTVEPVNSSFESLVVGVNVEGQYANLMHLLTLFEHLPYQVTIEKVVFEKTSDGGSAFWKSFYEIRVTKTKKHEN